ncbi:MAG: hypothetical protein FJ144_26660 [Deltaproteobacteria bacterium]|nr:hypothetical protein [Deltaproteobacteria bacterium]
MSETKSTWIRATGLWANERNGRKYLSSKIGGIRGLIFPNEHRRGEKDPTHALCIGHARNRPDQGDAEGNDGAPF